ncbi:hypothetical protein [Acinetobacter seifertii]|uniref:hypothetical protein n=1 Tax=Acinetobacter seifertii TaxID=1530123 RepID=UPI003D6CAE80
MFITSFGEQNITYKCCSNFLIHLYCNYHYTSQELVHESDKCTKHELGEKYGKEVMRLGMDQFEARKREDMKGQLCSTVLKEFPNYIRK